MTQSESLIASFLADVAAGQTTVARLKRQLAVGQAYVERRGAKNVSRDLIEDLAAVESAIARIEAEKTKYDRTKNN